MAASGVLSGSVIDSARGDSSGWSAHEGSGFSGRVIYITGDDADSSTGYGLGSCGGGFCSGVIINSRLGHICLNSCSNRMLDSSS